MWTFRGRRPGPPPYEMAIDFDEANSELSAATRMSTGGGIRIGSSRIRNWSAKSGLVEGLAAEEAVHGFLPALLDFQWLVRVARWRNRNHVGGFIEGYGFGNVLKLEVSLEQTRPVKVSNCVAETLAD